MTQTRLRSVTMALVVVTTLAAPPVPPGVSWTQQVPGTAPSPAPAFPPVDRPRLEDIPGRGIGRNFQLIGHNPLIDPDFGIPRGGNGNSIGIAGNCAYISSRRNNQPLSILDISNPANPTVVGQIDAPANPPSPPAGFPGFLFVTDLTAIESLGLLIVQVFDLITPRASPDTNFFQLYDIGDCFRPQLLSVIKLPAVPHEHFLWQSATMNRVLLYVSHLGSAHTNAALNPANPFFDTPGFPRPPFDAQLRVFDLTNFRSLPPVVNCGGELIGIAPCSIEVARFSLTRFGVPLVEPANDNLPDMLPDDPVFPFNAGQSQDNQLHSMATSADGARVYMAGSNAGFYILDSTPLATGQPCDREPDLGGGQVNPNACLKKLHPDPRVRLDFQPAFGQTIVHTALGVPGRPYVWLTEEPANPAHRLGCPGGWVRIAYVGDRETYAAQRIPFRGDLFPQIVGSFSIPENILERCDEFTARHPAAEWNPHKALVFRNIAFQDWHSGGIRAIDFSNPFTPREVGFFFPKPVAESVRAAVGGAPTGVRNPELNMRSFPMLKDGFIYVLDGFSGVWILKYEGPFKEELPKRGVCTYEGMQTPGFLPCAPYR